ncbi:MAG TPA: hypothetical protein PLN21_13190 [Gemmatales bacterium]|nr:hypothetical protein [Gemmatales bacterium]
MMLQLLFLLLGPLGYGYFVYARWCAGYRTEDWSKYQGYGMGLLMLMFLWFALILWMISFVAYTIQQEKKHRRSRIMMLILAIVFLVGVLAAFFNGLGSDSFDEGRKAMQAEINLRQLAADCLALRQTQFKPDLQVLMSEEMNQAIAFSPTIQRLRPNSISITAGYLILEFYGGFDHYGYQLVKDDKSGQWNLEWYTESSSEKLLSIDDPVK